MMYAALDLSLVFYLNYGPFTSYAPSYDSTFANIGKDDSDLLYTMYGEDPSLKGTFRYFISLIQFCVSYTQKCT